ncbi:MAG TPA: TIGR02466 family protein [Steroidobacteraceae bacterium]|nr:TIGR02466 family protein [Steroidobacteraceae bacterium]
MTLRRLFPTLVYQARLRSRERARLEPRLLRECRQLRADDTAGRKWSKRNYLGGYTSYGSVSRLHQLSPTFAELERHLGRHVRLFARSLEFDLRRRPLTMTDCWVNIMPQRVAHGLHLHPLSTLSGTYFLRTPAGCPGLKLEDPRLDRFMAVPPRIGARIHNRAWIVIPAQAGSLVLFESWLRHEVAPNPSASERISISFNYGWF